jgi:hypothetical protein
MSTTTGQVLIWGNLASCLLESRRRIKVILYSIGKHRFCQPRTKSLYLPIVSIQRIRSIPIDRRL